jgi:hypothetical protein
MDKTVVRNHDWTLEELMEGFRSLVNQASDTTKLAIFIDGLDEFAGISTELVQFITALSNPNVKVCVSSRPWIVFEDSFGQGPHLRLEDLTYNDIRSYVTSELAATVAFQAFQKTDPDFSSQLIGTVCSKASGVFLWVDLVTKSLLEGISEGERLSDLQRRLDSLPGDLQTLFAKIMVSLTPFHYERASQLFQVVRASTTPLSLLQLSFADDDHLDYAFNMECGSHSPDQLSARAELTRRRINACCKGLLDARSDRVATQTKVTYLHRTVKDFLEEPYMWESLLHATDGNFNPQLCLSNSEIAILKTLNTQNFNDDTASRLVIHAVDYAQIASRNGTDHKIRAINEVGHVLTQMAIKLDEAKTPSTSIGIEQSLHELVLLGGVDILFKVVRTFLDSKPKSEMCSHATKLLHIALYNGLPKAGMTSRRRLFNRATLISLLFEYGADPHEDFDGETAWELLRLRYLNTHKVGYNRADQAIIDQFHKYSVPPGPDPHAYGIPQAMSTPDAKAILGAGAPIETTNIRSQRIGTTWAKSLSGRWSNIVSKRWKPT